MSLTIALLAFALAFIIFLSSPMEMNVGDILFTIISAGRFAVTLIILQHFFNCVHYILLVICYLIKDTHPVQATPSDDTPVIPLCVSEVDPAKSSASSSPSSSTIPTRNSRFEKHLKSIQKSEPEPLWQTYTWLTHEPLPDSESNQSIFSPHRKRNPEPPSETTAPKPRRKSNILRHNQTNEHRPSQNLVAGPNLPQIRDAKDADAESADIAASQGAPETPSIESSADTKISTEAIPKDHDVESIAAPLQIAEGKSILPLEQSPSSESDTLQLSTSDSESSDSSLTPTSATEGTASDEDKKVERAPFLVNPEAHGLHSTGLFIPEDLDDDFRCYVVISKRMAKLSVRDDAEISLEISGTSIFSLPSADIGSASIHSPSSSFVTSPSSSTSSLLSPLPDSVSFPSLNVETDAIDHCDAPSVPSAEPSSSFLVTPIPTALSSVAEAKGQASTEENESKPQCFADSDGIDNNDQACISDADLSLSTNDSENTTDSITSHDVLSQLATHEALEGPQRDEDGEWDAHHPIPEQDIIMESQAVGIALSSNAIIALDTLPSTEALGNFLLESPLSACFSDSVSEPIQEDITLFDTTSHLDAGHLSSAPVTAPLISESQSSTEERFALNVWLPMPAIDVDMESVIIPDIALMEPQLESSNIAPTYFTVDIDTTTSDKSPLLADVARHIEESRAGVSFLEDIVMSVQDRSNETEAESPCNLSSTERICNNIQDSDNMSDIFTTDEDATLVFSLGWNGMTSEDEPTMSQISENHSSDSIADELLTPTGSTTDVEIVSSFNSEMASEIATATPLVLPTEIQAVSPTTITSEETQKGHNNDADKTRITSHTDFHESSEARPDIDTKVATPSELDQELPSPPISEITSAASSESDIVPFVEDVVEEEERANRDQKEETPAPDVRNSGETVPSPTDLATCAPLVQLVAHIEAAPMNESTPSSSPPAGSTTQPPPVIQKTEPITAAAPESKSATPSTPPPPMKAKPAPRPGFLISIKSRPAKPATPSHPSTGGRSNIKDALRSQMDSFVPVKPKQSTSISKTIMGSGLFTVDKKGKGVLRNGHMSLGAMKFGGHDMDRSSDDDDDERDDENDGFMGGPAVASDDDDDDAGSIKIHGVEISKAKLDAFTTKVRTRSHSHQWCSSEFLSDVVEKTMIECGIAAQIWEMASKSGMVDLESKRSNPRWYLMWAAKKWKFLPEDHRLKRGSREDDEDDTGEKAPKARKVVGLGRTRQVVVPSS